MSLDATSGGSPGLSFADSTRRIVPLAWPVFVGQVSVLAFSTVDTVLVARHGATDLAALAVGMAAYITVFIGFMGVVLALGPIAGRLFGAGDHAGAGRQVHQVLWIVAVLALAGSTLLAFPHPFLWLAGAGPEVAEKVRGYLLALAFSLPGSLLFTVYRGFNNAVSRPKAVMALQIGGLALKVPLSTLLVFGWPGAGVPSLGAVGCGIATAIVMWSQVAIALVVLRRDRFYAPFALFGRGLDRPDGAALRALLKLGVPMGATILIEVTGFSFMAFFISRAGTTAVAGHQIAANLVSLMFMMPMALANATGTLVAQAIGARREDEAMRLGWHGVALGCAVAAVFGGAVFFGRHGVLGLYSSDAAVVAAALPLLAWVAVFHLADAAQTLAAFVLRAWHVATAPMVIYAVSLWGLGLGGGYVLGFDALGVTPPSLRGAPGFWFASTLSLVVAGAALTGFLAWMLAARRRETLSAG
ncbi:MAG: MATE family efflux transporter [Rubrivivax sp.]|nr:MATE family efflux transporter [Rubrivivax sp.]